MSGNSGKSNSSAKDRVAFALAFLAGQRVEVTKTNGTVVTGVLTGAKTDAQAKGSTLQGLSLKYAHVKGETKEGAPMNLTWSEVASVFAADAGGMVDAAKKLGVSTDKMPSSFRTDTDISNGARAGGAERKLQSAAWLASPPVAGEKGETLKGASLEGSAPAGSWDQFKVNEERFGVKSTYDENLYTTSLDKRKFSESDRRRANRLARSIESQTSSNFHVLEERNQKAQEGEELDEESRYASVSRNESAYQPPHRRDTPDNSSKASSTTGAEAAAGGKPSDSDAAKGSAPKSVPPGMSWAARVRGSSSTPADSAEGDKKAAENAATAAKSDEPAPSAPAPAPANKKSEGKDNAKGKSGEAGAGSSKEASGETGAGSGGRGAGSSKGRNNEKSNSKNNGGKKSMTAEEKRISDRQRDIDGFKQFSEKLSNKKSEAAQDKPPPASGDKKKKSQQQQQQQQQQQDLKGESAAPAKEAASKTKALNSEAKEWRPNANAKEFTPASFQQQQQPPQPQQHMQPQPHMVQQQMMQGYAMPPGQPYMPPGYISAYYQPQVMYHGSAPGMFTHNPYNQMHMGYYSNGQQMPGMMPPPPQQDGQQPQQQQDGQQQHY
mmetsp:Transcript_20769/g.40763  ORF Transcript_20769/g.40763 Transcript_20769/m.40763 type:complete len:607 (+) Transcript_20769:985-2805(+)